MIKETVELYNFPKKKKLNRKFNFLTIKYFITFLYAAHKESVELGAGRFDAAATSFAAPPRIKSL